MSTACKTTATTTVSNASIVMPLQNEIRHEVLPTPSRNLIAEFFVLLGNWFLYLSDICYGIGRSELGTSTFGVALSQVNTMIDQLNDKVQTTWKEQSEAMRKEAYHAAKRRVKKNRLKVETQHLSPETHCDIAHMRHGKDIEGQEGTAYGYTWERFSRGYQLVCHTMQVAHLHAVKYHDELMHGFPDLLSKIVPERVSIGDTVEYWCNGLHKAVVTEKILTTGRHGNRTIYGVVPAFRADQELASGTPIFHKGKLVSLVTTSNGKGMYSISGISLNSGHVQTHRVRLRKAAVGMAVYGKTVAPYDVIKQEAVREKRDKSGPLNVEIVQFADRMDIVGWRGDNFEEFHFRTSVYCNNSACTNGWLL